jgi:hypothetical protein
MQPKPNETPFSGANRPEGARSSSQEASHSPDLLNQAKQSAGSIADQVKQQASGQLSGQLKEAAGGLETASHTMHDLGQQLREKGQEPVAEYVDKAADQVQRVSTYLRDKDFRDIRTDVEEFARRQPAMFLGGALGLGLLAARFLKSTPPSSEEVNTTGTMATPGVPYTGTPVNRTPAAPPRPATSVSQSGPSVTSSPSSPGALGSSVSTPQPSSSGTGTPGSQPGSTRPTPPSPYPRTAGEDESGQRRSA